MKQRLIKLEKAMREHTGHQCPLCNGEPWAEIFAVYGSDGGEFATPLNGIWQRTMSTVSLTISAAGSAGRPYLTTAGSSWC